MGRYTGGMRKRGFTLIELLVVIAIIGLLASIVMVSLGGAKTKSRDSKRQADIKNIQLALAVYYNENGMYPENIYAAAGAAPDGGLAPTYMPRVPLDPSSPSGGTCTSSDGTNGGLCYEYVAYTVGTTGAQANCSVGTPPTTYHLGANMENAGGSWALQDMDADNGGTYVYTNYAKCTLSNPGHNNFNGNSTACAAGTAAPSDDCYDVAP